MQTPCRGLTCLLVLLGLSNVLGFLCTSYHYYGCDQYGNCPQCDPCEKHADCNSVCTSYSCFCHAEGYCLDCVQMKLGAEELLEGVEVNENQSGHALTIMFKTCDVCFKVQWLAPLCACFDAPCNCCTGLRSFYRWFLQYVQLPGTMCVADVCCSRSVLIFPGLSFPFLSQVSSDCATTENIGTNESSYCSTLPENSNSLAAGESYCYPCIDMLGVQCNEYDDAVDECDETCPASASTASISMALWLGATLVLLQG